MHTLANGTYDGCSRLGLLKKLGLRELVVSYCHLRPVCLEVVWFKEEWQSLSDGANANHLVQPILLKVLLEVEDRYRLRERLFHLHNLRPEHWCLILLGAVAVIVDAIVIGTLGLVIVPAAALPEEAAKLTLYVLHGTDSCGFDVESTIKIGEVFIISEQQLNLARLACLLGSMQMPAAISQPDSQNSVLASILAPGPSLLSLSGKSRALLVCEYLLTIRAFSLLIKSIIFNNN